MAFTSLHSALCKHSQRVFSYSQQQSHSHQCKWLAESAHVNLQKIAVVSFSRVWAISSKGCCSCKVSQLPWAFPVMVPHPQTAFPSCDAVAWPGTWKRQWTQSRHSVRAAQSLQHRAQNWLVSSVSLHSSMLSNLWKPSRMAVNISPLQTSIIAPEIRSLLKF